MMMRVKSRESRVKSQSTGREAGADGRFTRLDSRSPLLAKAPSPPTPLPKGEGSRTRSGTRPSTLDSRLSRHGLTLIELLVVIIILTTLVAAAIPLMSPTNNERRLREASRGLNTFITGAQARAIQLQRPYGIALKKLSQDTGRSNPNDPLSDNGACLEVYYVEQPPPFTGFDDTSAVRISPDNKPGRVLIQFVHRGNDDLADGLPVGWDFELLPSSTLRQGDVIEVGGSRYELVETDSNGIDENGYYTRYVGDPDGTLSARPLSDSGQLLNFVYRDPDIRETYRDRTWTRPIAYQALRQPTFTSQAPYQLPEGTAIDLRGSGVALEMPAIVDSDTDVGGFFHRPQSLTGDGPAINNSDPVIIMFSPEGSVSRLRLSNVPLDTEDTYFDEPITANIFLLIGNSEQIPVDASGNIDDDPTLDVPLNLTDEQLTAARAKVNWLRPESRWVVIGTRSGRIVTAENALVDLRYLATGTTPEAATYQAATTPKLFRRAMQINEARTYAREMTQLGGR